MDKVKNLPETNNPKPSEYAPDEVNEHGDYIKIGGSPVPGLTLRHVLRGHTDRINRIAWSPDGKYLASPSKDKTLRIWDVSTGECLKVIKDSEEIYCVAWSPDMKKVAIGAKIVSLETERQLLNIRKTLWGVAFSPDGQKIVMGSQVLDVITGKVILELKIAQKLFMMLLGLRMEHYWQWVDSEI